MRIIIPNQADIDVWARSAIADRWSGSGTLARHVPSAAKDDVAMDGGLSAIKEIDPRLAMYICEDLFGRSIIEREFPLSGSMVMLKFKGYKMKRGFFSRPFWAASASVMDMKKQIGLGCFAAPSIPHLFDFALKYERMDGPEIHNTILEAAQNLHH